MAFCNVIFGSALTLVFPFNPKVYYKNKIGVFRNRISAHKTTLKW